MPLPGTRVIGDRWARHHAGAVAGTMTAVCEIRGPGTPGTFDPETGSVPAEPGPLRYQGPCRVQPTPAQEQTSETAGQTVTTSGYLVVIPATTIAQSGDVVTITDPGPNGALALTDRTLRVVTSAASSLAWETDLACEDTE